MTEERTQSILVRLLCWIEAAIGILIGLAGLAQIVIAFITPAPHGPILPALGGVLVLAFGAVFHLASTMMLRRTSGWMMAQTLVVGLVGTTAWLVWIARDLWTCGAR